MSVPSSPDGIDDGIQPTPEIPMSITSTHYHDIILHLLTIIDLIGVSTHISPIDFCTRGILAPKFCSHVLPILLRLPFGNSNNLSFNLATWNSHGLLGSSALAQDRQMIKKENGIRKLLTSNHVVCIQEDHADSLESLAFARKWSHSHNVFASNSSDRNCGGVSIAISRSFIADCIVTFMINIVPGRIMAVCIIWHSRSIMFVCIHNSPTWSHPERSRNFRLLASCIPHCDSMTTFIAGDLNFGLDCLRVRSGNIDSTIAPVHKALAELWDRSFPKFIEIAQDEPTFMRSDYCSNLDHVFTNLYTPMLHDLSPSCSTVWSFGDCLGDASDHVPIKVALGCDSGDRVMTVPSWVPSHPHFASHCASLVDSVRILPGHPFAVLQRHKDILVEASKLTLRSAHLAVGGLTIDQQIYWSMAVVRCRHDPASAKCKHAIKSYPYIAKFLDSTMSLDLNGLCEHISTLQYNRGLKCVTDGQRQNEDKARFKERMNKLSKYLSLWASKRRKITNLAILRDDGSIATSTEDSAKALGEYWEPQFSEPEVSIALAKLALQNFVSPCPSGIEFTISFEVFEERISALIDSGVGVDTLVYSCWKFCHQDSRRALYNVYLFLLDHKSDNIDFLLSRLVFIQKGKEDGDEQGLCLRLPKKTRPLCLANTDCKIVSCMISMVLSHICAACIASCQFGGMKGLQMIDHIFAMEAKIVEYVVCNMPNSGIFACDIAAAFPSLSRRYLLWVLRTMKIPRKLYRIIKNLHRASFAFVCVRNRLFQKILIASGVKQGDPSAMQLFILAYDPIIRFIDSALHPVEHYLFAYCDDLAIACLNLAAAWGIIMRCFSIIRKVSALALNADKTQFLSTSNRTKLEDIDLITTLDDKVSASQFRAAIKYLGIFLGYDALKTNWDSVSSDFVAIARFIGSLDCGIVTKVSLYNMLAISKLSFVAAFFPPSRDILKVEKRALQLLLRGPWNAIPDGFVKNLKCIGLPTQARDLATLSSASRIRVAASTSKSVLDCYRKCEDVLKNSHEVVLNQLDSHFLHQSCLHHVVFQHTRFVQEFPNFAGKVISQKEAYSHLFESRPVFDYKALLVKRLARYFPLDDVSHRVHLVLESYRASTSTLGFAPPLSHIRAICNHWCTYSRFGHKDHPCCFGCGHGSDNIKHVIACPKFVEVFFGVCGIPSQHLEFDDIIFLNGDWIGSSSFRIKFVLLATHICFLCYNACRHGMHFSARLALHKLYTYTRKHHKTAVFLRHFKYFELRNEG